MSFVSLPFAFSIGKYELLEIYIFFATFWISTLWWLSATENGFYCRKCYVIIRPIYTAEKLTVLFEMCHASKNGLTIKP